MKQSFSLSAFVIVALLSFNSCLGDKGNITISYGTGTILCDTLSNTPYIRLDDIGLCLTGNGVPTLSDSIARAMVNYTVDWDNQSATAQATGIFEASLSNLSTWGINKISSMPSDFSFIKTDTMQGIARPFITYKTPLSPNMLTMNVRLFNSTSSLELIQKNRPADAYHFLHHRRGNDRKTRQLVYFRTSGLPVEYFTHHFDFQRNKYLRIHSCPQSR